MNFLNYLVMLNNSEFTYDSYRNLLLKLKENYSFTSFSKTKFSNEKPQKKVLLRHDIDLSLDKALSMAEIESDLGISAVYFLFLRSPFYNIFSGDEERIIRKIIEMQHYIGLHFDFAKYGNLTISELSYQIMKEIDFLQDFYRVKIDAVSFHRPIGLDILSKLELSNYPHTYEPYFLNNFKYLSDSRGLWRYGHPLDSKDFSDNKNLHLLVHPIWWNQDVTVDVECIDQFKANYTKVFEDNIYIELKSFWDSKQ